MKGKLNLLVAVLGLSITVAIPLAQLAATADDTVTQVKSETTTNSADTTMQPQLVESRERTIETTTVTKPACAAKSVKKVSIGSCKTAHRTACRARKHVVSYHRTMKAKKTIAAQPQLLEKHQRIVEKVNIFEQPMQREAMVGTSSNLTASTVTTAQPETIKTTIKETQSPVVERVIDTTTAKKHSWFGKFLDLSNDDDSSTVVVW